MVCTIFSMTRYGSNQYRIFHHSKKTSRVQGKANINRFVLKQILSSVHAKVSSGIKFEAAVTLKP